MTLVKGDILIPMLQFAVAREAAGVPWPGVDRPIWHREQDAFSGEEEEAANVLLTSSLLFTVYWGPNWLKIKRLYLFS